MGLGRVVATASLPQASLLLVNAAVEATNGIFYISPLRGSVMKALFGVVRVATPFHHAAEQTLGFPFTCCAWLARAA
eukprot:1797825-Prymnesium_polylepis.2